MQEQEVPRGPTSVAFTGLLALSPSTFDPKATSVTEGRAENIVYWNCPRPSRVHMVDLSIVIHDGEEAIHVSTTAELDRVIQIACQEARARTMLNIIFLE